MAAKSQRVIISVGRVQIMLPDDTGAAAVLKTLSRGVVVWHFGGEKVMLRKEELEALIEAMRGAQGSKWERPKGRIEQRDFLLTGG